MIVLRARARWPAMSGGGRGGGGGDGGEDAGDVAINA